MLSDLKAGIRGYSRAKGMTALAVASLALGIMATTAMYSVIHAVVLNPFPYRDVERLVSIQVIEPGQPYGRTGYTVDQYLDLRSRATIFEGLIASTISDVTLTGAGDPQRLRGNHGPFDTFAVMGVPPLLGRTPGPADEAVGAAPVTVLGYKFWHRQYGGDPSVLGRQLVLNGIPRTVIGVMPPRFMWRGADVYLPVHFRRGQVVENVRFVHVLGRVKPEVTAAQAEAELRPILAEMAQENPRDFPEQWRVRMLTFAETFPSGIRKQLWILFGAVGLLLLIACANVSNLLLSRAAGRRREMAVRAALGAGKRRLVRQLLTESLALAAAGGALGVVLALGALRAMLAIVPPDTIPDEAKIEMSIPVLLFSLVVSVGTALLFGLVPALQTATTNLVEGLKTGGRSSSGTRAQTRMRQALVVLEVALAVVLLAGATLLVRSLAALHAVDLGFPTDRVLTMRISLPASRYGEASRRVQFFDELTARVKALPGVVHVGINSGLHPLISYGFPVEVPGRAADKQRVGFHSANREYLDVIRAKIVRGRLFTQSEASARQRVTVVNEAFAARYFAGREPVGALVRVPPLKAGRWKLEDDSFAIVGVMQDRVNRGPDENAAPEMIVPFTVLGEAGVLAVQTAVEPLSLGKAVAAQVYAIDPEQPVTNVQTVARYLDEWSYAEPRFNLVLFGLFAAMGLTLALVGVYGVIASSVTQRTSEIGIRMALGATVRNVVTMVMASGLRVIAIGLAVGLGASAVAARLLEGQLGRVSPADPWAYSMVVAVIVLAGVQACLWPARRAARIEPSRALREE
ncbi:MAG: ABC transporter permease [Bryobacteraceae bacterium]|nr:ABC transporter permease [Bryobacteraceae bacterium]